MREIRTLQQNKALYSLLSQEGINADAKAELVYQFTNGRTERSSEMYKNECQELIDCLQMRQANKTKKFSPGQKQRSKILSICHELGWFDKFSPEKGKIMVDIEKLNDWLKEKGAVKKDLNSLTIQDLNKVVTQFKNIRKKKFS